MIDLSATSDATPDEVWELYARPARWKEWAPHIRSARGLGDPYVTAGGEGFVMLAGVAPIPAEITEVTPGHSWVWRVGVIDMVHSVLPAGEGTRIGLTIRAPRPLELGIRLSYAPLAKALLWNLARVAAARG